MDNTRTKTTNNAKPYYYQDIIYGTLQQKIYIKKIIQEGSKQHKLAGKALWKKHLLTVDFKQIWKNTYISYAQPWPIRLIHRNIQE